MKMFSKIVLVLLFGVLASCQTRIVDGQKPIQNNSLELYQRYSVYTNDGKMQKVKVLRQDQNTLYGKTQSGEDVSIEKSDIRLVKKFNLINTIIVTGAAIAAVIFVPI